MQSSAKMQSCMKRTSRHYESNHFHVSSFKKVGLSIFLLLSVLSTLLVLKIPYFIPVWAVCIFLTYQLYLDIESEALSEAKRMKRNYSLRQINSAFKKPPSPKFDQHVRIKMTELIKKDAFKVTK